MKVLNPEVSRGIVSRLENPMFAYQGWPTVGVDKQGILYAAASGFRATHVCPFGKNVLYKSTDGGITWSKPTVVNDSPMDDRDAGVVCMNDGALLLSWFSRNPQEYRTPHYEKLLDRLPGFLKDAVYAAMVYVDTLSGEQKQIGSYIRISADGTRWDEPIQVPVMAPHGPNQCADGTLIYMGTEHHAPDDLPKDYAAFYVSQDKGMSWQRRWLISPEQWVRPGEELCEPHVVELDDGSLLGAFRVDGEGKMTIITTRSVDGGYTWTDPKPTGIEGAPPHLMRHCSGALLLSYGRRVEPYGQRVAVSYDNGQTWTAEYVLDNCPESKDLGYASTAQLPDGSLITVYYQHCPGDSFGSLLYTKWRLEK